MTTLAFFHVSGIMMWTIVNIHGQWRCFVGRVPLRLRIPCAKYTGYAQGSIELARRLRDDKRIVLEVLASNNNVPDYLLQDIKDMIVSVPRLGWLGVLIGFPPALPSLGTKYKIIYTMYETDDVPETWRGYVTRADEIWVPSQHCAKVFGKYNRRIRIIPFGYNEKLFKRDVGRPRKQRGDFRFGSVGVMSKRKGVDVLVRAFSAAFPLKRNVSLTIKTRNTRWLPEIDDERIHLIDTDWESEQLVEFYHDIDCLVQPSRGEGVGLPQLEAAACGTPVITTNWSGPVDYIDDNGIYGLMVSKMVPAENMLTKKARWAEPNIGHLVHLMKQAYNGELQVSGNYKAFSVGNMAVLFSKAIIETWRRIKT